jgi:glutathione S-transferase
MLTLLIGNRNYSSWSLRAWIMLRHLGLEFSEQQVPLDQPDTAAHVRAFNPAGLVPALRDGGLLVWDSLAICEYACELAGRGLPAERAARALARSVAAEMHSGFRVLRRTWPMNARATGRRTATPPALLAEVARIDAVWNQCRAARTGEGPWLLGDYSLADAMYAPVALRFATYGAALSPVAAGYVQAVLADPLMEEWMAAARAEPWVIAHEETGA